MEEEWRPVVGYEGLYEVSNLGRVKGLAREIPVRRTNRDGEVQTYMFKVKEKILKQGRRQDGYADVPLSKQGVTVLYCVHRLIADAWIPNPNNYKYVNHKDLDKTNNSLNNLEWISNSGNITHAVQRYANPQSIAIYCKETNTVYASQGQCELALGLSKGSVHDILYSSRPCKYTLCEATEEQIKSSKESIDAECGWTYDVEPKHKRLHPVRKLKCINTQKCYDTMREACEDTGLKEDSLRDSIRQKRTYKGFTFYYLDDPPADEETYRISCEERYYRLTHHVRYHERRFRKEET